MTLNGIDISSYQAGIPASVIGQADFTIVKVSEGTGYVNPAWVEQANTALRLGQKVGLYHYYNGEDGAAQARHYLAQTTGWFKGNCWPILDWEEASIVADGARARAWLDQVKAGTGLDPWFYTYAGPLAAYGLGQCKPYPLWLADYPYSDAQGFGPRVAADWAINQAGGLNGWTVAAWQYTSAGRLPGWGGALDLNVFFGNQAQLAAYCGTITAQTAGQGWDQMASKDEIKDAVREVLNEPSQTLNYTSGKYSLAFLIKRNNERLAELRPWVRETWATWAFGVLGRNEDSAVARFIRNIGAKLGVPPIDEAKRRHEITGK